MIELREIVGRLNHVHIMHRILIHRAAVACGIHFGQLPILEYIMEHEHCTQRELCDFLQVSPPSIATSIKRMQKAGLIVKSGDESDLRISRLAVTSYGRSLAEGCRVEFNKIDARMFEGFGALERENFAGYLAQIAENLSTDEMRGRNFFSLIEEDHRLHQQHKREVGKADE